MSNIFKLNIYFIFINLLYAILKLVISSSFNIFKVYKKFHK